MTIFVSLLISKTNKAIFLISTDNSEEKKRKWEEILAVIEDQYLNWASFDLIENSKIK